MTREDRQLAEHTPVSTRAPEGADGPAAFRLRRRTDPRDRLADAADEQVARLLSLLVHELRAPAAVVNGYLRLLTKAGSTRLLESERRMIEEAGKCCARLLRLVQEVEDLETLDQPEGLRLAPVAVFSLCEEAVREAAASGDPMFRCSAADRRALVRGEPDRLKQAFASLVALTVREHTPLPVEVFGFVVRDGESASAIIGFGDPGLADRPADVLDERAAEFDRWRVGMGLMVPIASRIVELHGGRLWSLPRKPRSACAVSLPLADP